MRGNHTLFCIPYHKCENHTVTFFEKREELCHQKHDMPLGSFSLNIFIFCCKHINKYTGSNRSARMMSIFQGIQNCKKKSEKNDNKTGDYSSFKITKKYFRESHYVTYLVEKWKVPYRITRLQFYHC